MAKSKKKNIKDFQKALLNQTSYISNPEEEELADAVNSSGISKQEPAIDIDEEIYNKLKVLADYQNRDFNQLITHALSHYLVLNGLRLRDAFKEMQGIDISVKDL